MSAEAVFFCFLIVDEVAEILLCSYSLNIVHTFYLHSGSIFHEKNAIKKRKRKSIHIIHVVNWSTVEKSLAYINTCKHLSITSDPFLTKSSWQTQNGKASLKILKLLYMKTYINHLTHNWNKSKFLLSNEE